MSIDFSKVTGWSTKRGNLVQVADSAGRVIWAVQNSKPIILQVAKQTLDTYAGETTYTGESFIAINIYPKTNGTVNVTYGGLTKTITDTSGAESPNAQKVYFGTLYGVSDSVTTPTSGTLTIEGDYQNFSVGTYDKKGSYKTESDYCGCITAVSDFGDLTAIYSSAFRKCTGLTSIVIPNTITSIGSYAFYECKNLVSVTLPSTIESINSYTFYSCKSITSFVVPNGVKNVGDHAFYNCNNLASITFPATLETVGQSVGYLKVLEGYCARTTVMLATTPPTYIESDSEAGFGFIFTDAVNTLIVPKGSLSAYQTAKAWKYYADGTYDNVSMVEAS